MVRPIEMQDLLSKTKVVERVHQQQKAAPEQTQRLQQAANADNAVIRQKKPNEADQTEGTIIKEPKGREQRKGGSREEEGERGEREEDVYEHVSEEGEGERVSAKEKESEKDKKGKDSSHINFIA